MNRRANFHCHSTYSDGINTPEEMVLAALDKGFAALGFSDHGWTPYDSACCVAEEDIPALVGEVRALRERYRDRLEIYLGVESDYYCPADKAGLDYTIGSVHYLRDEGEDVYYTVDYKAEDYEAARDRICGGDIRRMVELYYEHVVEMANSYEPDIIGHLDLITKLNGEGRYFDESADWYLRLCEDVAQRLHRSGCIVELNTGGISRGYREEPYPSRFFLERFRELGTPLLLSSDAHSADQLDYWFDEGAALLREVGFRSAVQLAAGAFVEVPL